MPLRERITNCYPAPQYSSRSSLHVFSCLVLGIMLTVGAQIALFNWASCQEPSTMCRLPHSSCLKLSITGKSCSQTVSHGSDLVFLDFHLVEWVCFHVLFGVVLRTPDFLHTAPGYSDGVNHKENTLKLFYKYLNTFNLRFWGWSLGKMKFSELAFSIFWAKLTRLRRDDLESFSILMAWLTQT